MKIKQLEWKSAPISGKYERYTAESPFGTYEALEYSNAGWGGTIPPAQGLLEAGVAFIEFLADDKDNALFVAQTDFEARIRAWLEEDA